jgi:hypothetical protein
MFIYYVQTAVFQKSSSSRILQVLRFSQRFAEDSIIVEYDAVSTGKYVLMFQTTIMASSSRSSSPTSLGLFDLKI